MLVQDNLEVLRVNVLEVDHRAHAPALPLDREQLKGLDGRVHLRPVHDVPHHVRVQEDGQLHVRAVVVTEGAIGRPVDAILQILRHGPGNLDELVADVDGEVDVVPDSAHYPRDIAKELVHPILLPRHAVLLHGVEEDLSELLAVIMFV